MPKKPATKKKHAPKKKERFDFKPYIFGIVLSGAFCMVIITQFFMIHTLSNKVDSLTLSMGGVIDEVGAKLSITDQLELFGSDLNEIREYLYLPTKNYAFGEETLLDDEAESSETVMNKQLFLMLESLHDERTTTEHAAEAQKTLSDIRDSENYNQTLSDAAMSFGQVSSSDDITVNLPILQQNQDVFTHFTYHGDIDEWELFDYARSDFYDSYEQFATEADTYLLNISERLNAFNTYTEQSDALENLLSSDSITSLIKEKNLTASAKDIKNTADETVASAHMDAKNGSILWTAGATEQTYTSLEDFQAKLPNLISSVDVRSSMEKKIEEQKNTVLELIEDPAFSAVLKKYGLSIATTPIDETDRLYFPLSDENGVVLKQIVIEKNDSADILVVDGNGTNAVPLSSYAEELGSKKK